MLGEASRSAGVDPDHHQALRDLHADLRARGFFAPSHFWRWKLMVWVPVFFAAYFALLALPFGVLWLAMVPVASVAFLTATC